MGETTNRFVTQKKIDDHLFTSRIITFPTTEEQQQQRQLQHADCNDPSHTHLSKISNQYEIKSSLWKNDIVVHERQHLFDDRTRAVIGEREIKYGGIVL